jgi:hypothetical protein
MEIKNIKELRKHCVYWFQDKKNHGCIVHPYLFKGGYIIAQRHDAQYAWKIYRVVWYSGRPEIKEISWKCFISFKHAKKELRLLQ